MISLLKKTSLLSLIAIAFATFAAAAPEEEKAKAKDARGKGQMFSRADADGNGTISLDEFVNGRVKNASKRFAASGATDEEVAARIDGLKNRLSKSFAMADADENGELTQEEFAAAMQKQRGGKGKKKPADS